MYRLKNILRILYSYTVNFPVLSDWGFTLHETIGLVFSDLSMATEFCQLLSETPFLLNVRDKSEEVKKTIANANSEAVCLFYRQYKQYTPNNVSRNLNIAFDSNQFARIGNSKTTSVTFLIFMDYVPEDLKRQILEIHINAEPINMTGDELIESVPKAEELALIKHKIGMLKHDKSLPLKAAATFLVPYLEKNNNLDIFCEMLEVCETVINEAEDYRETDSVKEYVVSMLEDYYTSVHPPLFRMEDSILNKSGLEEAFLMGDDRLYIHEKLFKEIVKKLTESISIDSLKYRLVKEHVMLGEAGSYTKKVGIIINGNYDRIRMLCFDLGEMPRLHSYLLEI